MKPLQGLLTAFFWIVAAMLPISAMAGDESADQSAKSQAIQFLENTELHGTADISYNYNFNRPERIGDANANGLSDTSTNLLRAFDRDPNSFSPNLFELAIQNQMTKWAQFRVDLDLGRDAQVFKSFGFNDGSYFELQQAYLYLTAPIGTGLHFKVGKFVTMHGAEVIESAYNYNSSRGLLFTWAIPFTHTGLLMDYTFNDYVSLSGGVVNGWDNVKDNNNGKTFHGMLTLNPIPSKLSVCIGGTVGPEQDNSDGNLRGLVDGIVTWNARDDLTFVVNADVGKEEGIGGTGFANWWGTAAYVNWKAPKLFGLSVRGEYFVEDTPGGIGVRTGTAAHKMGEGSVTTHLYLFKGFDLRFEYRHDRTANAIFAKSDGTTSDNQNTVMAEAVYSF